MERDWKLGLIVAKNVDLGGVGQGRRTDLSLKSKQIIDGKVSAREFERSFKLVSAGTVAKILKTWNRAAKDSLVPHSDNLTLESLVVLEDDFHTPELWNEYYNGGLDPSVYIIGHKDFPEWPVKIGKANDCEARLGLLQCGTPWELEILLTIPGGFKEETELHQRFEDKRVRGEWYLLTQKDLEEIK